jgi:hypothetical protein
LAGRLHCHCRAVAAFLLLTPCDRHH